MCWVGLLSTFFIFYREGAYLSHIPFSYIRNVRPREVKLVAQHHMESVFSTVCLIPKSMCLTATLHSVSVICTTSNFSALSFTF